MTSEKAREVGGIGEAESVANLCHRKMRVEQCAPGLEDRALIQHGRR